MSNLTVPAAAGGMPKFNRSQIMKDAWKRWHDIRAKYAPWQLARGIVDGSFSACLKSAWRVAKNAAAAVAYKRKVEAAMEGPKGATVAALVNALQNVDYASFRYRAADQRAAIQAQIDQLISEAA